MVRLQELFLSPLYELVMSDDVEITSNFQTTAILDPSLLIFPEPPKTTKINQKAIRTNEKQLKMLKLLQ